MKYLIYISLTLFTLSVFSQERDEMIRDTTRYYHFMNGETAYNNEDYKAAEEAYLLSDSVEHSFESMFNIGDALFMQDSTVNAINIFSDALTLAKDKNDKALIHHNIGNCHLKDKAYDKAIAAYKSALRNDPRNEETRYNLAYAKKMLENQDQGGDGKSQDQQENQDKEDKEDKEDNEDSKDKKDEENKDKDKEKEDEGKEKDQKDDKDKKSSEDEKKKEEEQKQEKSAAEKMLDALEQEEQDKRKGMRLKEEKGKPKQIEKDW